MNMWRRFGAAAMASAICMGALAGCGGSSDNSTTAGTGSAAASTSTGSNDYSIDFVFKTTSNEYTQYMMAGAQAAADELGVSIDMKGATSETSYDEQQNMIETDLNANKYDAMVIAPLQGDLVATLVSNTDLPIFAIDTDFESDKKISFIGIGQADAAAEGGKAAVEAAKEAGWEEINAICIAGVQGDSTAEARKSGYQKGIEAAGGTFLEDEMQYADAVADKAVNSMEAIMQNHPEGIAIIVCHNDDCAMAAARAAQDNEAYKNTIFVGFDGNSSACESVLNGEETMTVAQGGYEQGYNAVYAAVDYLNGKDVESFIDCGTEVITQDTAQARLDKLAEQMEGFDAE